MKHICEECGAVLSNTGYFFNHLNNKHNKNLSKEEFYDLYLRKSPDEGKCLKCGVPTGFFAISGLRFTYRKYCRKCKTEITCQKVHGCNNYRQTKAYKESYKNTCLEKYGKESTNQVEEIKEKKIQTNLERTGYKWPLLNPEVLAQIDETNIERYGTSNVRLGSEYATNKSIETCLDRYGVKYPMQCKEIQKKSKRKYFYNDIYFDSSYELAYYIWLTDNKIDFEYHNSALEYKINEETHYYFPDFKVNGEYIELKGSHLINENGILIEPKTKKLLIEKTQCLIDNKVKIITDCTEQLNYVKEKYGNDYIKSFRVKY